MRIQLLGKASRVNSFEREKVQNSGNGVDAYMIVMVMREPILSVPVQNALAELIVLITGFRSCG